MKEKLNVAIKGLGKVNLSLILFVCFGIKTVLISSDFASAAILAVLASTYCLGRYLSLREPNKPSDKIKNDIIKLNADVKELKGALTKTNVAKITQKDKRYF